MDEPTRPLPPSTRMRLVLTSDTSIEGDALLEEGASVAADAAQWRRYSLGRARWGHATVGIVAAADARGSWECICSCWMGI